jgi:hypothetical protein
MAAPGADALRQLGCSPAIVMDMTKLIGNRTLRGDEPRYVVTCDVAEGQPPPTCEHASGIYFAGAGGSVDGNVNIRIARRGSPPSCSRLYAASGADLGQYPRAN